MNNSNFLSRIYTYQKERFPLTLLVWTTLAVVLSSLAVIAKSHPPLSNYWLEIVLALTAGLIFMFNVRVLDERKDLIFDTLHHKDRPIQRGIISLNELFILNILLLFILFGISAFSSFYAFFYLLIALVYSMIAGLDFFLGEKIRKMFFLYNFLCLIQLFFFQIHLYALMTPKINFLHPLLYVHFIFVVTNAGIIEIGRKLKVKSSEGSGNDTYSSRMGKNKSAAFFISVILITFAIFSYLWFNLSENNWLLISGGIFFIIAISSTLHYLRSESINAQKIVEITGIIYYLALHLLIALTLII